MKKDAEYWQMDSREKSASNDFRARNWMLTVPNRRRSDSVSFT